MKHVLASSRHHFLHEFSDFKRKKPDEFLILRQDEGKEHAIFLNNLNDIRGRYIDDLVLLLGWKQNVNYNNDFIKALIPALDELSKDYFIKVLKTI